MKALSLLAFATIFLLSSALPDGKGKGHQSSLLRPNIDKHGESLQRRKPPVKIPGPALTANDPGQHLNLKQLSGEDSENVSLAAFDGTKNTHLDSSDNDKRNGKSKHLNNEYNAEKKEESQEKKKQKFEI